MDAQASGSAGSTANSSGEDRDGEPDRDGVEVVDGDADDLKLPGARRGRQARPVGAALAPDEERPGVAGNRDPSEVAERLRRLKSMIRSDIRRLEELMWDAVARKIQLGGHLAEAQECCRGQRGAWTDFLKDSKVNDRTAREALAFFRNRAAIEGMRHGRAALAVADVRLALSKPRPSGGASSDNPSGVDDPHRGLPLSAPEVGAGEARVEPLVREPLPLVGSSDGACDVDSEDQRRFEAQEQLGPTAPVPPSVAPQPPAGNAIRADLELEYFEVFEGFADGAIRGLEAGRPNSTVEALRRVMPILHAALLRLDAALKSIDGAGRMSQPT
jgi:hypothetical protein